LGKFNSGAIVNYSNIWYYLINMRRSSEGGGAALQGDKKDTSGRRIFPTQTYE
jgi:hypothetical protein